jgi:hypothetical protein
MKDRAKIIIILENLRMWLENLPDSGVYRFIFFSIKEPSCTYLQKCARNGLEDCCFYIYEE